MSLLPIRIILIMTVYLLGRLYFGLPVDCGTISS